MPADDRQLFRRFRDHGDVAALSELFDRTAPALLRLAMHLSRDASAAEDLVQSTFLRAIEARDDWDPQRPPLPWLCGILQNRARHDRWQRNRVPDAARLNVSSPPDPARTAEGAELDAAVDAAIAELPEAYRTVLRLHLLYGHEPAAIAHALERPPGTVRSQLARGLEALRRLLPSGFAGATALWLSSGRGLAAVKQVVLAHGAATAPIAATALLTSLAIMKKITVVAALALLTVTAFWQLQSRQDPSLPDVPAVAPATATSSDRNPLAAAMPSPTIAQRIDVTRPAQFVSTGKLAITCRFAADDAPAADVLVSITPLATRDGGLRQRLVRTDAEGFAAVDDLPCGRTSVTGDRGGSELVEVLAGATSPCTVTIPVGIDVHGTVVDEQGLAVPRAQVWLSAAAHDYCDGEVVTSTDSAGRFSLRAVEPERFVTALSPGLRTAPVEPVQGDPGAAIELQLVLSGRGQVLRGLVLGSDDRPVANAHVFVGRHQNGPRWSRQLLAKYRPPLDLRTASDGTFEAHGLAPGSKQPLWVRAIDYCVAYEEVTIEPDRDAFLTIRLAPGAALAGTIRDDDGAPVANTSVQYRSSAWFPPNGDFHSFSGPSWAVDGAVTDAAGCYAIDCITPGTLRLLARKDTLEVRGEVAATAGRKAEWSPVLCELTIRGLVTDERGVPLHDVRVTATPPRGKGSMSSTSTDAEGRFTCRTLLPLPYTVDLHALGLQVRPTRTLFGIEPSPTELQITLPDANLANATITGRLLDRDGSVPHEATVRCSATGWQVEPEVDVDPLTGAFSIGPIPAGVVRLQGCVRRGDSWRRSRWSDEIPLARGATRDIGVLTMPATGSLTVLAKTDGGLPLASPESVVLVEDIGWSVADWLGGYFSAGRAHIDDVAAGTCRLGIGGVQLPRIYREVTVLADQDVVVELEVPAGVPVRLVLSTVSEPVPIHETFVIERDGKPWQRYTNWWEDNVERTWAQHLLPGTYDYTITSETGRVSHNVFVVAATDAPDQAIPIRMP